MENSFIITSVGRGHTAEPDLPALSHRNREMQNSVFSIGQPKRLLVFKVINARGGKGQLGSETCWHFGTTALLLGANVRNFPGMEGPNFKSYFSVMENLTKRLSASSVS